MVRASVPGMPEPEMVTACERIEVAAWRDHYEAAPVHVRAALGVAVHAAGDGVALVARGIESLLANRIVGLGLGAVADETMLDAALAHYRGQPGGFAVNLSPRARPTTLAQWLARRGMATFFHHLPHGRAAGAAPDSGSSLLVRETAAGDAARWSELATHEHEGDARAPQRAWHEACVGRPGWVHLLAWRGDTPVATAAMFVHGDAAWLGHARTLPGHRRMGAQRALLAARIRIATQRGARWLATETGPDWPDVARESLRNVRWAGFTALHERPSWIPVPA